MNLKEISKCYERKSSEDDLKCWKDCMSCINSKECCAILISRNTLFGKIRKRIAAIFIH